MYVVHVESEIPKFGPKPRLAETIVASAYHFPEVGKGIVDVPNLAPSMRKLP